MHLPLDSLRYFLFDQSALPQFAGQSSNPNTDGWVRRTIKLSLPRILAVTVRGQVRELPKERVFLQLFTEAPTGKQAFFAKIL
jgi:hypothetical protein